MAAGETPEGERLQKVLAAAGVASRRASEHLIREGRVEVDGVVVTELGTRVDPATAEVRVDGDRVVVDPSRVYLAVNKPRGVLSTMHDDRGRRTVADLVADRPERLFHVGRLDADTEGLLVLTNDGALAQRLAHPSHGVEKTYLADVDGSMSRDTIRRILAGIELDDGPVTADRCRVVDRQSGRTLVEIVLHEGRNRIVRRLFDQVGHPVRRLVRTQLGPVRLADLPVGATRPLTSQELATLLEDRPKRARGRRGPRPRRR